MRKTINILFVFSFLCACHAPERVVRNHRFFYHVDSSYSFSSHNILLNTSDRSGWLINPVVKDGYIIAELGSVSPFNTNLIFTYNKKYGDIVQRINDSSGKGTTLVRLSTNNLMKIHTVNQRNKVLRRKCVYHFHPAWHVFLKTLMYIAIIYLILGTLIIIGLFTAVVVQGCFIATMVYGSYDAPEVMALRSYRDEKMRPYFFGRVFIRIYYLLSPCMVRLFKNNTTIKTLVKAILDKWVVRIAAAREDKIGT